MTGKPYSFYISFLETLLSCYGDILTTINNSFDLDTTCGYITLINIAHKGNSKSNNLNYSREATLEESETDKKESVEETFDSVGYSNEDGHRLVNYTSDEASDSTSGFEKVDMNSVCDDNKVDKSEADIIKDRITTPEVLSDIGEKEVEICDILAKTSLTSNHNGELASRKQVSGTVSPLRAVSPLRMKAKENCLLSYEHINHVPLSPCISSSMSRQDSVAELDMPDSQWLPSQLCYGLPLFDTTLNREVCDKV